MKKKIKIILFISVIVLLLGYFTTNVFMHNSLIYFGDTKEDIKSMLMARYRPGNCYGMPPGVGEPNIKIEKQSKGWHYIIEDGQCCDITIHEGVVEHKGWMNVINETKTSSYQEPC
jgi:hypothetical protein